MYFDDREYQKSVKTVKGTYELSKYNEMIEKLGIALKVKLPSDKAVVVNFRQDAVNCIPMRFDYCKMTYSSYDLYGRFIDTSQALNFFVATEDSPTKDCYPAEANRIIDSGFFKNEIFTNTDNCEALYILRPDRKYLIKYGGDYADLISEFLANKN